MPRMNMILGQPQYIPQMIGRPYASSKNPALPMNKTANVLSLRFAMIERVSSSRPSCGSCGKR